MRSFITISTHLIALSIFICFEIFVPIKAIAMEKISARPSNAMIRDVLTANPQSAKSDDILNTLDSRFEPMPEYMMAQIMEGREYFGAKELLEAKIRSWKQIRAKAKSELLRQFLLDTNIINPLDSIIAFLDSENDLKSKYDLGLAYWNNSDTISAKAILENIPFQFSLNDDQINLHQQYNNYFNILELMADSSWKPFQIDSASINTLFDLLANGNADMAALSRGLLVKGGFLNYIETIGSPNFSKSSSPYYYSSHEVDIQHFPEQLRLFPNPAGDYVIAYYNIDENDKSGCITIRDMQGNRIRSYPVDAGENQQALDLKNLPNGIYIVSLLVKDRELPGKTKLIKARH